MVDWKGVDIIAGGWGAIVCVFYENFYAGALRPIWTHAHSLCRPVYGKLICVYARPTAVSPPATAHMTNILTYHKFEDKCILLRVTALRPLYGQAPCGNSPTAGRRPFVEL